MRSRSAPIIEHTNFTAIPNDIPLSFWATLTGAVKMNFAHHAFVLSLKSDTGRKIRESVGVERINCDRHRFWLRHSVSGHRSRRTPALGARHRGGVLALIAQAQTGRRRGWVVGGRDDVAWEVGFGL